MAFLASKSERCEFNPAPTVPSPASDEPSLSTDHHIMDSSRRHRPRVTRRPSPERRRLAEEYTQQREQSARLSCNSGDHGQHTRHNCPRMPCNYCKKPNHTAANCPRLQTRRTQGQRRDSLSISLTSDPHDDALWEALPPAIRDVR